MRFSQEKWEVGEGNKGGEEKRRGKLPALACETICSFPPGDTSKGCHGIFGSGQLSSWQLFVVRCERIEFLFVAVDQLFSLLSPPTLDAPNFHQNLSSSIAYFVRQSVNDFYIFFSTSFPPSSLFSHFDNIFENPNFLTVNIRYANEKTFWRQVWLRVIDRWMD